MTKGRIEIRRVNIMGCTPDTQMYYVNSTLCSKDFHNGYNNTVDFLNKIARWLTRTTQGYCIVATRLPKFKAYCNEQGFEVVEA